MIMKKLKENARYNPMKPLKEKFKYQYRNMKLIIMLLNIKLNISHKSVMKQSLITNQFKDKSHILNIKPCKEVSLESNQLLDNNNQLLVNNNLLDNSNQLLANSHLLDNNNQLLANSHLLDNLLMEGNKATDHHTQLNLHQAVLDQLQQEEQKRNESIRR